MAAYRRVDDLMVTCRLTACTPGSALGPTLGIEYGKPLPLPFTWSMLLFLQYTGSVVGSYSENKLGLPYPPYSNPALAQPLDIVNLVT